MPTVEEMPGDALVIRFRPTAPDSVRRSAIKEHRRAGHYGCSVFADVPRDGESEEDVIQRLLSASALDGIDPERNPKCYVCGQARNLLELGFVFMKDGGSDELPEHFCVNLGEDEPDEETVGQFLSAFDRTEKRKQ